MMIFAVMMSMMLMPAQMMAKNNQNAKPRIEYKNSKKDKPGNDRNYRPGKPGKPMPPVVVKRPKPKPMPKPMPRPVPRKVYVYQDNSAINAAAAVIGIAGLIALIAD